MDAEYEEAHAPSHKRPCSEHKNSYDSGRNSDWNPRQKQCSSRSSVCSNDQPRGRHPIRAPQRLPLPRRQSTSPPPHRGGWSLTHRHWYNNNDCLNDDERYHSRNEYLYNDRQRDHRERSPTVDKDLCRPGVIAGCPALAPILKRARIPIHIWAKTYRVRWDHRS